MMCFSNTCFVVVVVFVIMVMMLIHVFHLGVFFTSGVHSITRQLLDFLLWISYAFGR